MTGMQTLFVVDDDYAIRRAFAGVGTLLDTPVKTFDSGEDFLEFAVPELSGCLILDVKMPGMTGLELQCQLIERGVRIPVIMISGHANVRIAVDAMARGALTLLEKPFSLDELLGHIRRGLADDRARWKSYRREIEVRARLDSLTDKERGVLDLIRLGCSNRDMAERLNITVRAVEDRRSRVMSKMQAPTIVDLLRTIEGLTAIPSGL
jgi:FixJ family two-component response regulator